MQQWALPERDECGGPGNREGQGADSHPGDHYRPGDFGGRGDWQPGREVNGRLTAINGEHSDMETRLETLYQAVETQQLPIEVLSPRILSLTGRQCQLVAAREEADAQLEQRRAELPA